MRHDFGTGPGHAPNGRTTGRPGRPSRLTGPRTLLRRLARDRRGAIAAIFALVFPVVLAILGLGIETGIWFDVKRHNQSAADVGAYSGALELAGGGTCASGSCSAGTSDAVSNSVCPAASTWCSAADTATATVTAASGVSTVKVAVAHQQAPIFTSFFGLSPFTVNTQATATVGATDACASGGMGKSHNNKPYTDVAIALQANSTITMPGCTLTTNSTNKFSIDVMGSGSTIDAYTIYTAGGIKGSVSGLEVPPTTNASGAKNLIDPYAGVSISTSPIDLTSFTTMPSLSSSGATSFPTASASSGGTSITTPTTRPTTLAGSAPSAAAGGSSCSAATTINTTQTINGNSNGACYTSALTIQSPAVVTFNAKNGSGQNTFNFNGGLTVDPGAKVIFINGGNKTLTVTVTGGFTINGTAEFNPGNYGFSAGVTTGAASSLIFDGPTSGNAGGPYNINNGAAALQITHTATFLSASDGSTSYEFYNNGLTINNGGTASFSGTDTAPAKLDINAGGLVVNSGGTLNLDPGSYYVETGGLSGTGAVQIGNFTGNHNTSSSKYALRIGSGAFPGLGGVMTLPSTAPTGIAFYGGAVTINAAMSLPATNYCFDTGALNISSNVSFAAGTTTLNVPTGGITTASGATTTFTDSSSSKFYINTGGANQVALGGTTNFGSGAYYFTNFAQTNCTGVLNATSGGTGVAINGTANFGNAAAGGGIYSVQTGGLTIANGTTSSFYGAGTTSGTGTTCAATTAGSCLYVASGAITNNGTLSFADSATPYYVYAASGSITNGAGATMTLAPAGSHSFYINNPSGAFTNSGTLNIAGGNYYIWNSQGSGGGFDNKGTLNTTGDSGNFYFFYGPSFGTGNATAACTGSSTVFGALSIEAGSTASLTPANYYIVNGDLCINQTKGTAPAISCADCSLASAGGLGLTFILTATGTRSSINDSLPNVSTVQIPDGANITTSLIAPSSGNYKGLVIYQDRAANLSNFPGNSTLCQSNCNYLDGGSNMRLGGVIYMPQAAVEFSGGAFANCLTIIASSVSLKGNSSLDWTGCPGDFGGAVKFVTSNTVALTN